MAPHGQRLFPANLLSPFFKDTAHLADWIAERVQQGDAPLLDEGIMLWGAVRWADAFQHPGHPATIYALTHAEVHVVVATGEDDATIEAVAEGASPFQYLRLDYDRTALGPMLKEPAPHVHVHIDGEPRFGGVRVNTDCPIADFLDFIFRNYRHTQWTEWLYDTWYMRFVQDDADDVFDTIKLAYGASNLVVLTQPKIQQALLQIRRHLTELKRDLCPIGIPPDLWDIVAP